MLSIGEFSKICEVSTKTLRYYDQIDLIKPSEINHQNGYRYYSIAQLETMLFINRLKSYNFSLDEIKDILSENIQENHLYLKLKDMRKHFITQVENFNKTISQMDADMFALENGKSIMSYLDNIDIQLVECASLNLLSIRKTIQKIDFPEQYGYCFNELFRIIERDNLVIESSPMVLFHDDEFGPLGLDIEFAIPITERGPKTRIFQPGLCIKTTLCGSYVDLPSIYAKQIEWTHNKGYVNNGPVFEVYITDPSMKLNEKNYITEVYSPLKKV